MSVYTTMSPQLGQQYPQQSNGYAHPFVQPSYLQQQDLFGQFPTASPGLGGMPFTQPLPSTLPWDTKAWGHGLPGLPLLQEAPLQGLLPQIVTDLALKCAAATAAAVIEQLRIEPQALVGIQTQGQIPAHLVSSVLVECARRVAPVIHLTLAQLNGRPVAGQSWPASATGFSGLTI
ncbi:hypothetical protein ACFVSN_30320 [Kitasatospora sp. NPDC057904]|uniref:hypothetical protein n=1 Tax=unclassified Kitasatospora TaxID=2633591 RepID=UPI0036D8CF4B